MSGFETTEDGFADGFVVGCNLKGGEHIQFRYKGQTTVRYAYVWFVDPVRNVLYTYSDPENQRNTANTSPYKLDKVEIKILGEKDAA